MLFPLDLTERTLSLPPLANAEEKYNASTGKDNIPFPGQGEENYENLKKLDARHWLETISSLRKSHFSFFHR